ncbi:MAG TPA: sulfite exporter TauE/SafE family protein [Candidatus Dormibacteraeota bacterium]|nr:sulfite exporter TauE/SafE family protein [Candidatus Dormibacteraeota bacterium]
MHSFVLLFAGFLAALLGTMGGGGAGFVSIYVLLLFGLPINAALATFKFGDLGFSTSLINFARQGLFKKQIFMPLLLLECAGALIGTFLIIHLSDTLLKYTLTIILIPLFVLMLSHGKKIRPGKASIWWKPVYFFGSVSLGAVQAGSFIQMFSLMDLRKVPALEAAANRFLVVCPFEALSVAILLLFSGLVNVRFGIPLIAGNVVGSYFGSKIAIRKGSGFVRYALLCLMAATVITVWLKRY